MSGRERPCDRNRARARAAIAREYLRLAELAAIEDRQFAHNAAAGNAVLAASDAICCMRLGRYFANQDHRAAARLLGQVLPNGPDLAKDLLKVLATKDQVHYAGDPLPDSRLQSVLRSAERLVDAAERTLSDP